MKGSSQSCIIEVQLICYQYGNVAALHSCDCSVQRRHQKVEHPVTEWIIENNLILWQVSCKVMPLFEISHKYDGFSLFFPHFVFGIISCIILEIRWFYGMEHRGGFDAWRRTSLVATPFYFDKAERSLRGCPDDSLNPSSGKVQELSFKRKPNIWACFLSEGNPSPLVLIQEEKRLTKCIEY